MLPELGRERGTEVLRLEDRANFVLGLKDSVPDAERPELLPPDHAGTALHVDPVDARGGVMEQIGTLGSRVALG